MNLPSLGFTTSGNTLRQLATVAAIVGVTAMVLVDRLTVGNRLSATEVAAQQVPVILANQQALAQRTATDSRRLCMVLTVLATGSTNRLLLNEAEDCRVEARQP